MKKSLLVLITLMGLLFLGSCRDIIEPSLAKDKVVIVTPQDTIFSVYHLNFTWDLLDNATKYEFKVIQLDSHGVLQYDVVLDTTITLNSYAYTFSPSYYQIWVRGVNNSSKTDWTMKRIKIAKAPLYEQTVTLDFPSNKFSFNSTNDSLLQPSFALKWEVMPGKNIVYKILYDSTSNFVKPLMQQLVQDNSIEATLPGETTYYWKVKALQTGDNGDYVDSTAWSSVYSFLYDVTPPNAAILGTPTNGATAVAKDGNLIWTSTDKNVSFIVNIKYGNALKFTSIPVGTLQMRYSDTALVNKIVTWSVDVKDRAGNVATGLPWSFTTQ